MYVTKEIQNQFLKKKNSAHHRSVLREMMSTCDKLGNAFLSKRQTKMFEQQQKSQLMALAKSLSIERSNEPRYSAPLANQLLQEKVYVKESKEIKQIKDLREKLLPKVSNTVIKRKMKQMCYIKNMGYKNQDSRLENFKAPDYLEKDIQKTLNSSWESIGRKRLSISNLKTLKSQQGSPKKHSYMISKPKLLKIDSQLSGKTEPICKMITENNQTTFQSTMNHSSIEYEFVETVRSKIPRKTVNKYGQNTLKFSYKQNLHNNRKKRNTHQASIKGAKNKNKNYWSEKVSLHENSCDSKPFKKNVLKDLSLDRERIQEQDGHCLYKLIRGGYEPDSTQVEGEYISLKRFKESSENFVLLDKCINEVKEPRYVVKDPIKQFGRKDFKSLVFLNQVEHKMAPSMLKKLLEANKAVR